VSQRRQDDAPREIRATRRLAAIVESSDDAIVSKDLNGVVTSWNRAAERMFGYTAAEMVGRSIHVIIPDDRHAEEDDVLAHIRRGGLAIRLSDPPGRANRSRRADGSRLDAGQAHALKIDRSPR
jgi:PAS domain S-box-containing protein